MVRRCGKVRVGIACLLLIGAASSPASIADGEAIVEEGADAREPEKPGLTVSDVAQMREERPAEKKISGSAGIYVASHFINYGLDTWGAGDRLFGGESTVFADARLNFEMTDSLTLSAGVWGDINDNGDDPLGGSIQEIDFDVGVAYTIDRLTLGIAYLDWNYTSDMERFVDFSIAFDDSGLISDVFSFNPSFIAHLRVDENGDQEVGACAFVLGVAPSWIFNGESSYPLKFEIPVDIAFVTDAFHGGDGGFAYASAGAALTVPLAFIPSDYGNWSATANLTYYLTDADAIPGNPENNFLTAMIGVNVAF